MRTSQRHDRQSPAGLRLLPLLVIVLAGLTRPACALTQQVTLREQLNQRYAHELVVFPFAAAKGACTPTSLALTGPRGPQAVQLSDIVYWPDRQPRFVRSAKLSFISNALEPLATNSYTITYGTTPAATAPADLVVRPGADTVEIATSHMGVRLLLGAQTYTTPLALAETPGPLRGMHLGDGTWAGGSRWHGTAPVKSWSARLTEQGPVFARVEFRYLFADGTIATFQASLAAGDNTVRWDMDVNGDQPALRLDLRLPPVPGVKQAVLPKGYGQWARDRTQALTPADTPFCYLSPDTSFVNSNPDSPPCIRLIPSQGTELQLRSRDPGAWVDPVKPLTYAGYPHWRLDMVQKAWVPWKGKRMPVSYATDGMVTLQVTLAQGRRKWSVSAGNPLVGEGLNRVKEMVLDWPQTTQHPHLYMTRAELAAALKREPATPAAIKEALAARDNTQGMAVRAYLLSGCQTEIGQQAQLVPKLKRQLEKLGYFDIMREAIEVLGLYDSVIDSDLVTPQERKVLRAQMAYLGYVMADPMCWSMERGYLTGNPNMSLCYTFSLGLLACMLPDHPIAPQWAAYSDRWMEKWLADEVGTNGEWLSEGISYGGQVSLPPLLAYAVAAKRTGYRDVTNDPRLRKLLRYYAMQYTPPEPRRKNMRLSPPVGRAHAWQTSGYLGLAAKMTAPADPDLSRALQWLWAQGNYAQDVGNCRLGGFEALYLDKTLPAEAPHWGTVFFPTLGAVLRDGFNTPNEHYLNFITHVDSWHNLDIWTPDVGNLAVWYAYGKPVFAGFNFGGSYYERHELLRNGVMLARNYDGAEQGKTPFGYYTATLPGPLAALPGADYVRATYRVTEPDPREWFPTKLPAWPTVTPATAARLTWMRQALYLRDADGAGPHWLLLRDTATGGQPTEWQFWTLSEKLGTPAQAREATFLADKPGNAILPVRPLPASDRYTAVGQYDVDMEYFIASPAQTPRHTLRYGGASFLLTEYQDLLHLQQPGDGAYYVAIYPRKRAEGVPDFTTLADGKLIKVTGVFGTDYALLATDATTATTDEVRVTGTAVSVQVRPTGTTLSLSAAGTVQWKACGLQSPYAAALLITPAALTLTLPADYPGGILTVIAPAGMRLQGASGGVKLVAQAGGYTLSVPKGVTTVNLAR